MEMCPIPKNKNDLPTVESLLSYEGPVSEKEYQRLITWLKDENWPVFRAMVTFIVERGVEAEPAILYVLKSKNGLWKKNVIQHILSTWPKDNVKAFSTQLTGLATDPDPFGPDLVAARLLLSHQLVDPDWLEKWLKHKRKTLSEKMKEIEELLSNIAC